MKKRFCVTLALFGSLFIASISNAETVFYRKNTKITSVDCENNSIVLSDSFRKKMPIRKDYDKEEIGDICKLLSKFAEGDSGTAKPITLLTAEKKSIGDSIYEQEVIGFLDKDNIRATNSADERDPVYTQYCGALSGDPRSSAMMCLMVSNSGLFFIEFKSPQQYQLNKTRVVSASGNQIVLESKDSKGNTQLMLSGLKSDESTFEVTVKFVGGSPASAVLKK